MPSNIQLATGTNRRKGKNIWKIQCHKTWQQPNDHICSLIAVNRFAFKLKHLQTNDISDKELLQLINTPDTLKDENLSAAANLFEYLLKNKLDLIKVHKETMMTIEDEEYFKQIDQATIEQMIRLDAKLKQLTIGCTRKSKRLKTSANTQQSIEAKKKCLQNSLKSLIRKKRKITNNCIDMCFAGELCHQQKEEMILEGESKASKCHSCTRPCHYTCIYEKKTDGKDSELFCSKCYQKEVVQAKDASVLFADLLKSAPDLHPKRLAISIAND